MSATVPATSGAEKLVPSDALKLSVYVELTGAVVPVFVVVRIGYRHGEPAAVLTQLPPGALIATSGPRSEKPTLVPTWRSPATAITPLQFAGAATAWPARVAGRGDDHRARRGDLVDRLADTRPSTRPSPPRLMLITRAGSGWPARREPTGRRPSACRR